MHRVAARSGQDPPLDHGDSLHAGQQCVASLTSHHAHSWTLRSSSGTKPSPTSSCIVTSPRGTESSNRGHSGSLSPSAAHNTASRVKPKKSSRTKEWAQVGKRATAAAATGLRTSRSAVAVRIPPTRKVQPILNHRPAQREIRRGSRRRPQVREPPPDVGDLRAVRDHLRAVALPREVVQP